MPEVKLKIIIIKTAICLFSFYLELPFKIIKQNASVPLSLFFTSHTILEFRSVTCVILIILTSFFQGAKPWRCRSFCHFRQHYPTMQSRHQDALFFMCNRFPPIQSKRLYALNRYLDYFRLKSGILLFEPKFFQFTCIAFQKVSTQSLEFRFFGRFFFKFREA